MQDTLLLPPVYSFYRSNISSRIIEGQARVFAHLGIDLVQCLDDGLTHSQWLDRMFSEQRDITVVCDIDAFPLSRAAYVRFVDRVRSGTVVGLEQVANHLDPTKSYAAPMFLGCLGQVYRDLGCPSLANTAEFDVGQNLTHVAEQHGVPVEKIAPQFAIRPKWPLADRMVYGIGTFFGSLDFFHLFESRLQSSVALFAAVSEGTIAGKHDFARYLVEMELTPPPPPPKSRKKRRRWWRF